MQRLKSSENNIKDEPPSGDPSLLQKAQSIPVDIENEETK